MCVSPLNYSPLLSLFQFFTFNVPISRNCYIVLFDARSNICLAPFALWFLRVVHPAPAVFALLIHGFCFCFVCFAGFRM